MKGEEEEEERQQPLNQHPRFRRRRIFSIIIGNNLFKQTSYTLLLLLAYALGYFSSNSSPKIIPPPVILAATATPPLPAELQHFGFTARCADPISPELARRTILDRVFNGTSPFQDFPPAHVGDLLKPKRIRGWGSNGAVFENLIKKVKPKVIIEVGTFLGASAVHMAELTRRFDLKSLILCIDDFRGWPGFRDRFKDIGAVNGDVLLMYQFMQNVVHVNATGSVLFMPFSTGSSLGSLCEWGITGDLIEVDAGHDFHSAWSDINRAYKLLRPGGVIFGHDYFTSADNKGVRRAVNLFARVNNLRVRVDGQHWVIHPS